ncbi:MAG: hypothetical protein HXX17_10420 [Geobacteraceae bacterium]|nr:hypothetical protein [Geobacteraceae bacterium]
MNKNEKTACRIAVIVGIVTLLSYLGSLSCGFINLDDPFYVANNPFIKNLDFSTLYRLFTEAHLGGWLPLTYLSFAVDYHIWGTNPAGYHLTNVLLHAINAGLVVHVSDRLMRAQGRGMRGEGEDFSTLIGSSQLSSVQWYSAMLLLAGLFWGLHPLRVESVAWVAERKDVLNGFFTLTALLVYLDFVRRKESGAGVDQFRYLLALGFFVLSLMAKQVSVTLPVILLLLDWYPLGRFGKGKLLPLLVEKVPFFGVAACITLATIYFAAEEKMLSSMQDLPFYVRVLASGNAIFEYCRLTLYPVNISPYVVLTKPLPTSYLVKTAVVAVITLYLLWKRQPRPVAATWFAFVIVLLPMLAFVQAGDDIALAARYTYLPAIAPAIAAAAALGLLVERLLAKGSRRCAAALVGICAVFLALNVGITLKLINVWKDTGSFWSRVIEIRPVGRAYADRGVFSLINGRAAAAIEDFTEAIRIAEGANLLNKIYNLYAFRGVALSDVGRYAEAVADFDKAIELFPHPTYFQQRARALEALGKVAESKEDLRRAGANPPPLDWF